MKTERPIIDYGRFSDAALSLKSLNIKNCLTDNENFVNTTPPLATYSALQAAFELSLGKAISGDRIMIALKNQARQELVAALRQLGLDIEVQANGDKAKLLSSGFDLSSTADNPTHISAPSDFRIIDGLNPGEIKFMCKRVPNAKSYLFEFTEEVPTEDTKWAVMPSTSRELTIKRLRSNTRIYGRIKAIGTRGQEATSDIQSRLVQ